MAQDAWLVIGERRADRATAPRRSPTSLRVNLAEAEKDSAVAHDLRGGPMLPRHTTSCST